MSLRTKLVLAFLLLAVVPLAAITFYSYNSSIEAFRKATEAESGVLAEELGSRMDSVRRDLAERMDRLSSFPFRQLMAFRGEKLDLQSNPLMAELMTQMGAAAGLVDSIEFRSTAGVRSGQSDPGGVGGTRRRPPVPSPPAGPEPQSLVIHLAPEAAPAVPAGSAESAGAEGVVMHFRPVAPPPPLTEEERQKVEAEVRKIQEYRVVLQKLGVERRKIAAEMKNAIAQAKKVSEEAARVQRADPLAGNFGSVVHRDGEAVGTIRARVSARQVFREILSRSRRHAGEIPFLIDGEGKLQTVRQQDQAQLEGIALPGAVSASTMTKDWVVVTRQDPDARLTFGIARPVGAGLREIRTTAVRNLGIGFGMVGLALIGIIPLSNRMTRNLAVLAQGAEKLAGGDFSTRVEVQTHDEIGRLAGTFNRMARDLSENQKRLVEQERLRKELEMSRRIQAELLPRHPLQLGLVEAKGVSIPAREVGGDFFNYFPLPNDEVAILVGDVSGKGVAAALMMANLQATLQSRLPLAVGLDRLASQLDHEIDANTPPEVYLTLFMGVLNTRDNRLRYVNAGHNTQFALHRNGGMERLESTGRPLGLLPGGEFYERHIDMAEGDALFLYTDGLVEAEDPAGREFGLDRLEALLAGATEKSIEDILVHVEDEARKHRGEIEAADDATMVVLKLGTQTSPVEVLA